MRGTATVAAETLWGLVLQITRLPYLRYGEPGTGDWAVRALVPSSA